MVCPPTPSPVKSTWPERETAIAGIRLNAWDKPTIPHRFKDVETLVMGKENSETSVQLVTIRSGPAYTARNSSMFQDCSTLSSHITREMAAQNKGRALVEVSRADLYGTEYSGAGLLSDTTR